jgi:hypothetical protein
VWTLEPPLDKTKISAISIAGDYLFLGYSYFGSNSREGTIRVYKAADGSYVGEITPTPSVGAISGTFDIPYAIRAFKRKNGEHLVFAEDDHYAKVIVYRWNPSGTTVVDTLATLNKTDAARSSSGWRVDASNAAQFQNDAARATRITDTTQSLVWKVTGINNFASAVYYDSKLDVDSVAGFFASADGKMWEPVKTARTDTLRSGGGWSVSNFRPSGTLPPGTLYLKFQILPTGESWNVQLGRMELFAAPLSR